MRKYLNKIISKIKGEEFIIDNRITSNYIIGLAYSKGISLLYGKLCFPFKKKAFIHPSSRIKNKKKLFYEENLSIDRSCYIDALSSDGINLGKNVSIGKYTCIECTGSLKDIGKGLIVGNNVGLGTHCFYGCAGGIEVGENTIFGNYVSLHSENHRFSDKNLPIRLQGVTRKGISIGNNCWIGAKSTILDGAKINNGCIIAAGSVITAGIYEENCIYGGNPAKLIKKRF